MKESEPDRREIRPLNQREIDRRIEGLTAELAREAGAPLHEEELADVRPRTISPRELVRRMRPFIVLN